MDTTKTTCQNTRISDYNDNLDQISITGKRYSSFKNYYSTWNTANNEESTKKPHISTDPSINDAISISSSTRKYRVTFSQNTDTLQYEPYDHSKTENSTGFYGTIFHLIIISAGPGMLTLPKIYLQIGTLFGIFGTFFTVALYNHCCHIFTKNEYKLCKRKKIPSLTYPDTIYTAFHEGPSTFKGFAIYAKYITYLVFIIPWEGGNSLNIILITENLQLICKLYDYDVSIYALMIYSFLPLLMLCWIPNLKYLVPISLIGSILNFLVVLIIVYHMSFDSEMVRQYIVSENNFDLMNLSSFFGSLIFCINASAILMPLKNEMHEPRRFSSAWGVLNISNFFISLIYAGFNIMCCLKYGTALQDNVVMNLPKNEFATKLTILMFVMAVCLQFPLVSYTVFDVLWNIILKEKKSKLNNVILYEYLMRSAIVVGAYIFAIIIPSIQIFTAIAGTLASTVDGIVFPSVIDQLIRYTEREKFVVDKIFVKDFMIFCLGMGLIISGFISFLNSIL